MFNPVFFSFVFIQMLRSDFNWSFWQYKKNKSLWIYQFQATQIARKPFLKTNQHKSFLRVWSIHNATQSFIWVFVGWYFQYKLLKSSKSQATSFNFSKNLCSRIKNNFRPPNVWIKWCASNLFVVPIFLKKIRPLRSWDFYKRWHIRTFVVSNIHSI